MRNNAISRKAPPLEQLHRRLLLDSAFRGSLGVGLYLAFPAFSDVYRLWERSAGDPRFAASAFEYPPISALYFWPLTFLPSSRWAVFANGVIMVAAVMAVTWLLARWATGRGGHPVDIRMWVASPALMLLLAVNWDVLVGLFAVLGVIALYQHREAGSGFWLGFGTAFKVFPGVIVLPTLPLLEGWRRRIMFLLAGGLVLGVSYVLYAWLRPDEWLFHLEFASQRTDFDLTIWDLLDRALDPWGASLSLGLVNTMSTVALAAAVVLTAIWSYLRKPTYASVAAVALIALLVFNKVFKPQYVLWVIPFLAWVGVSRWKVRTLEAVVILQFAAIYFPLPPTIFPLSTVVSVAAFGALAYEIVASPSLWSATRPGPV